MASKNQRFMRRTTDQFNRSSYTMVPRPSQAKHSDTVKTVCPTMKAIEERRRFMVEQRIARDVAKKVAAKIDEELEKRMLGNTKE